MIFKTKSTVLFGDVNLSDFSAFAYYKNHYDGAERDVETITVPGRSGDLVVDNGRYKNNEVVYRVQVTGQLKAHHLRSALLSLIGYFRIEDEYEPEIYRVGRLKGAPTINRIAKDAVSMTITLDCKPQRFLKSGELEYTFTANGALYNPTLYNAAPLVRVYGYGAVGVGANTITVSAPASGETWTYIDIDCELQDAFSGTTNLNGKIQLSSGKFFSLVPGSNGVSVPNTASSVVVIPRWKTQ